MSSADGGWYADWTDLGVENQRQFREQCQNTWNRTSATLEAREIEQALQVCAEGLETLDTLDCDELRALYHP